MTAYADFLADKIAFDRHYGQPVTDEQINPLLKPHQRRIVQWAVEGGRRAIFAAFGLGKSIMQLETLRLTLANAGGGRAVIVCPLGVRIEFAHDAKMLGIPTRFVRRDAEVDEPGIYVTNYESIRDGRLNPDLFDAVSLDEASVLRSYGSKTYQEFLTLFDRVPYRFVATATPSPNRYKELIHYAGFLGVMDTGQALTRFFQRDSTKANNLTLYPHKVREFHLWLNTWSIFLQHPHDICRCSCHASQSISQVNASASLSPSNGTRQQDAQADGYAAATAERSSSSRRLTSRKDEPAVADASARTTGGPGRAPTPSGKECSTAVAAPTTRTGQSTAGVALPSASAGISSRISSPTWDTLPQDVPSTESTTTATTNRVTVDGQRRASKQRTGGPTGAVALCAECACDGYDLPPLAVQWHEVDPDLNDDLPVDRDGQGHLVRGISLGLKEAAAEKRRSMPARVAELMRIVRAHAAADNGQIILWCNLNDEQTAIERALAAEGLTYSSVHGSLDPDDVESRLAQWRNGDTYALIGKPVMLGQGMNFQQCWTAVYVGLTFSFNDLIQSIHRIQRFGQTHPCTVHLIHAESEREVVTTVRTKWAQHKELTATMTDVIRKHGLSATSVSDALKRSMGVDRVEASSGDRWLLAHNDCVPETESMDEGSVDLIVTSIPFANHYEYTPSYNDFGHTDDNDHFWSQMDYLTPQLLRILAPGRIYACHVKDRINFGAVTGAGVPTVSPFHAEALFHAQRHGFDYLGMITVVTDVVRENNQTYRLGWSEMAKDGTKMGVGSPEYVLIFHKPQTDRSRGYADVPVTKDKSEYTRARWQVDAHAFWRSSGNRMLTPDELAALPVEQMQRLFTEQTLRDVYDYESHVRIGEDLDGRGALPATFMSLAPGSWTPDVWHDVDRMRTLNGDQRRRNVQMHVCPLQFDIVERLIRRYSNPGDLVFDPFAGLGTVPLVANRLERRGRGSELNPGYWADSVKYLEAEERKASMPSLFDLVTDEQVPA